MSSVSAILLCVGLFVSSSTSFLEVKPHDHENHDTSPAISSSSMEDDLLDIVNHFTTAHQKLAIALKIQNSQRNYTSLGFPNECIGKIEGQLEYARHLALGNFTNCNVLNILTDLAIVMVDSVRFAVEVSFDSSLIVAEVLGCSGTLNPFVIIRCIYKAITVLPEEFKGIVDIVEDYKDAVEYFVPKIFHSIESCFNKTASEYNTFIDFTLSDPQVCKSG